MSILRKCDRCPCSHFVGKETELPNGWRAVCIIRNGAVSWERELCNNCMISFHEFMTPKEVH